MIAPWFGEGAPLAMTLGIAVVIGLGFGFALERAGLGSACKLAGQFYGRDLSVLKVMFSALIVAMLGLFWVRRFGGLDAEALFIPPTYLGPQLLGAALFGAGLLVAGLCPGTACVAAATGRIDGLFVLLGLLIGMLGTGLGLTVWPEFYISGGRGAWTLAEWLDLPEGTLVAMIVVLAFVAFGVAEQIERRCR